MYISRFVKLCEKAWALKVLALIGEGTAIRVAVLAAAAGTTRSSIRPSIQHLYDMGLIVQNRGHGHPLRPEARLTAEGEYWAALAARIHAVDNTDEEQRLVRLNWTLPVLRVAHAPVRFTELRNSLSPVGDSALSLTVRRLGSCDWLERQVDAASRPPHVAYAAINRGYTLAELLTDSVALD